MQHLDEGTIHAWLDGALSPEEAARVEAHAAGCPECAAAVAEARGFIAASSRILTALDNAPRGVIPAAVPRKRVDTFVWRIAATMLVVAAGTLVVVRNRGADERSEATIAAFTRQLFAIRQSLKNEFPLAAKIETPDTDKDATIPVHPGAAAFVDGDEKTFLDRYSDYIWWGLMALSAMGSAGAWFAGYLKKDERVSNSSQRDRLLDMLRLARHCDSTDELDRMQAEADDILRDTLKCFEHNAIDQGALSAFNIALEQFHNAVADRKALLISIPQNLQRASAQFRAAGSA